MSRASVVAPAEAAAGAAARRGRAGRLRAAFAAAWETEVAFRRPFLWLAVAAGAGVVLYFFRDPGAVAPLRGRAVPPVWRGRGGDARARGDGSRPVAGADLLRRRVFRRGLAHGPRGGSGRATARHRRTERLRSRRWSCGGRRPLRAAGGRGDAPPRGAAARVRLTTASRRLSSPATMWR